MMWINIRSDLLCPFEVCIAKRKIYILYRLMDLLMMTPVIMTNISLRVQEVHFCNTDHSMGSDGLYMRH